MMILHHYELSPFSEKIRLMLGYCGLEWTSVISPAMPPRAIVDPLAGGYRRIPVVQVGSDIFCDTKLIGAELASMCNKPELSMETCGSEIREYSHYVDTEIFFAGIQSAHPLTMLLTVFKLFSPIQALRFIKDRTAVQKTSSLQKLSRKNALTMLDEHFKLMESKLEQQTFLFGDTPSIADFSAHHNLWFKYATSGNKRLDGYTNINRWFQTMSSFGHGKRIDGGQADAFSEAKNAQPREISDEMRNAQHIGERVEIRPADYAKNAVSGVLVGDNESRWILLRNTNEFGDIHVHFPKQGFELCVL